MAKRSTRMVMWITAVMMGVEIAAGWLYNSMALLADGWHISSHAVAIGLSAFAYAIFLRRGGGRPPGVWFGGAQLSPQPIRYQEAIAIAVLGLLVNRVCALILGKAHKHEHEHHGHGHGHAHDHGPHQDLSLKSAYIHVIADAATSMLAIAALLGGWLDGWTR